MKRPTAQSDRNPDVQAGKPCCAVLQLPLPHPIEREARERLTLQCPYGLNLQEVTCHFEDGALVLRGRVPTFYLKQLVTSFLWGLEGVDCIDNQIEVVYSAGLGRFRRA